MSSQQAVIHIIDDDASFRSAIGRLLRSSGYRVAYYELANQAVTLLPTSELGCILLDVQMPGLNGMQFQEQLAKQKNTLPIIFVTGYGDIKTSVRAIKAGAEDYLTKPIKKGVLLDVVARTLARSVELQEHATKNDSLRAVFHSLTERERDVFALVVRGRLNKQIAHQLGTSLRTVKAHRHNAMEKLQAKSVPELVSIAFELGLTVA